MWCQIFFLSPDYLCQKRFEFFSQVDFFQTKAAFRSPFEVSSEGLVFVDVQEPFNCTGRVIQPLNVDRRTTALRMPLPAVEESELAKKWRANEFISSLILRH